MTHEESTSVPAVPYARAWTAPTADRGERAAISASADRPAAQDSSGRTNWSQILLRPSSLLLGLKLFKMAKLAKAALIGASVAAYSWFWTWEFAVVLVIGILVHEYGHVLAMKRVGIPTKGAYMIPGLGAVAVGEQAKSRWEEFFVAAGGPLFGAVSLLPLVALYGWTAVGKWLGYASVLALVNLFNLLPIGILDGGRILRSVVASIGSRTGDIVFVLSLGLGAALVWQLGSLTLGIILMLSVFEFLSERKIKGLRPLPAMTVPQRVGAAGTYLVLLLGFLAFIAIAGAVPEASLFSDMLRAG